MAVVRFITLWCHNSDNLTKVGCTAVSYQCSICFSLALDNYLFNWWFFSVKAKRFNKMFTSILALFFLPRNIGIVPLLHKKVKCHNFLHHRKKSNCVIFLLNPFSIVNSCIGLQLLPKKNNEMNKVAPRHWIFSFKYNFSLKHLGIVLYNNLQPAYMNRRLLSIIWSRNAGCNFSWNAEGSNKNILSPDVDPSSAYWWKMFPQNTISFWYIISWY